MSPDGAGTGDSAKEIGLRIAERRKVRSLTQKQLADAIGIEDQSIPLWERGLSTPSRQNLAKVAGALDTTEPALRYCTFHQSLVPSEPRAVAESHITTTGRPELRPLPYERVYWYLEQMRAAGMPKTAVDEARRYLVEPNFGRINKRDYRERPDDEVIADIDAMWAALKIRFERDWGIKL